MQSFRLLENAPACLLVAEN